MRTSLRIASALSLVLSALSTGCRESEPQESEPTLEPQTYTHAWSRDLGGSMGQSITAAAITPDGGRVIAGYQAGGVDIDGGSPPGGGVEVDTRGFLARYNAAGELQFSRELIAHGSPGATTEISSLAVDAAGNIVVTGYFDCELGIAGKALYASSGGRDGFLAKLDASGKLLFGLALQTTGDGAGRDVAVDADGNIVLGFTFTGAVGFTGKKLYGNDLDDGGVARFDAKGNVLWMKLIAAPYVNTVSHVAIDGAGRIHVAGQMMGSVDLGGGPKGTDGTLSTARSFVAVLASDGTYLSSRSIESDDALSIQDLATSKAGNSILVGSFRGRLGWGGHDTWTSYPATDGAMQTGSDAFVVELNDQGNLVFGAQVGGELYQRADRVTTTEDGSIVVSGFTMGNSQFDGTPADAPATGGKLFVAKLHPSGEVLYQSLFGQNIWSAEVGGLAVRGDDLLLAGSFATDDGGQLDFGGGAMTVTGQGYQSLFVAELQRTE
jgi:hypothetical protein